ncbi:MAG: carbamoyl-phosphate synthase large subunit [Prevotella sp.]|nr:carbamoyl-phosphate synthase large subunit [Prevotella sp.]
MKDAKLILEDGTVFQGKSFGYEADAVGEVVFNTAMTGYPESLTDPSYAGQILVMTYPLVGNYGVPLSSPQGGKAGNGLPEFMESDRIHVKAMVVADYSEAYSHWNAKESLGSWLKREHIPGITGIDTRRLTQVLREHGVMMGRISLTPDPSPRGEGSKNLEDYGSINWVEKVSCKEVITYKPERPSPDLSRPQQKSSASVALPLAGERGEGPRVVLVDCGVKANIIRCLLRRGVEVIRVPWDYDFNQLDFDGLFLANGPGDPEQCEKTVEHIRTFLRNEEAKDNGEGGRVRPLMGICLGNQLLARAAGAKTYKLKYGHRSHNQPVMMVNGSGLMVHESSTANHEPFTKNHKCFITSQNHGYAVDASTLPDDWEPLFVNMNDGSNEGIRHKTMPWFSAQFHPEACSGPTDTEWMFDEFVSKVNELTSKLVDELDVETKVSSTCQLVNLSTIKSVLLLGSGALKIGQAGEFDYSGAQALKALKEEGVRSILINPNIATVQTSKDVADVVYFQPVTPEFVERVIAKERPDGILLSFGGQTALNCGVELYKRGVLEKYGVKVLGTPVQAIIDTEDRDLFVKRLDEIGVKTIKSEACETVAAVQNAAHELGFPVILRAAYALGGLGSGFCDNDEELLKQAEEAFAFSPQVLVEKSLRGWKEIEYEVVRDRYDNCITVCNMENFDPLGIHTGESIVVAPSQTLSNSEYHKLRALAIKIIRHIGIVGECNVQYALDPNSEDYRVIEVNARLSRSSALASKATGYPLAFVAAKLGLGYGLFDLKNSVTKTTSAFFEPALDYVVCKIPRWDLSKFHGVNHELGSSMKSVGEVMAVGRTFEEAIQKGLRMIGQGMHGFVDNRRPTPDPSHQGGETSGELNITSGNASLPLRGDLEGSLQHATDTRIFVIAQAMLVGYTVEQIHALTKIDRWFLHKLKHIVNINDQLQEFSQLADMAEVMEPLELIEYLEAPEFVNLLRAAKVYGFSDFQIARALGLGRNSSMENAGLTVRAWRKELGVVPTVSQIDTLAAEYPAQTNYLYLSYL